MNFDWSKKIKITIPSNQIFQIESHQGYSDLNRNLQTQEDYNQVSSTQEG